MADSGTKSYTYVLQTAPSDVATLAQIQLNAGNTRYLTTQVQDVRGSTVISAEAGKPWLIDLAGLGVLSSPSSASDPRAATGSAWSGTITYPTGAPLILEGCTVRLYDPASATLYGGGTLGTPGTAGDLLTFSLDAQRQVTPRVGASASSGIHGALPNVNAWSTISPHGLHRRQKLATKSKSCTRNRCLFGHWRSHSKASREG